MQRTGVEKMVWSRDVSLLQRSLTSRSSAVCLSFLQDLLKFSLFNNHHRYCICFAGAVGRKSPNPQTSGRNQETIND